MACSQVDWWALGCVTCELLTGRPPFEARDLGELVDLIKAGEPPAMAGCSQCAKDFVVALLKRDPEDRLGGRDVQRHCFFEPLDFAELEAKRLPPPLKPDTDLKPSPLPREAKRPCAFVDTFRPFNRASRMSRGDHPDGEPVTPFVRRGLSLGRRPRRAPRVV